MAKTIRFSDLVRIAGRPKIATLWTDPANNTEFTKAARDNRVLTVTQETTGNKKDFGQIGFKKRKHVSYLIFPEPLPDAPDSRVIGIKYDLVNQSPVSDPIPAANLRTGRKRHINSRSIDIHFGQPIIDGDFLFLRFGPIVSS